MPEKANRTFTDSKGRTWIIEIGVLDIKRIRAQLNVDLAKLFGDGLKPLLALLEDPVALVDVLFLLCQKHAAERNVSDEDFGRALVGDHLGEAVEAFTEALIADTVFAPAAREKLRSALAKGREVAQHLDAEMAKRLEAFDPAEEARKLLEQMARGRIDPEAIRPPILTAAELPTLDPRADPSRS